MVKVITLELNELDFELLGKYASAGRLPNFARLFDAHDVVETIAEQQFEHLEPWIQWVTAHTGLTFAQHRIFRLGDIVDADVPQLWEILERRGLRVGAMSPMNASNRLERGAFFVPDPWTRTNAVGSWDLQLLTEATAQAVNDNAHGRISLRSYAKLAAGALVNVRTSNLRRYGELAASARTGKWRKALLLDLLLSDAFIKHCRRSDVDYASLFLNAGAHVQHHYMFSSTYYDGPHRNPSWYVEPGIDPVGEVYELYDRILGNVMSALPGVRLLLCTGLSQRPNSELVFYYRPRKHRELLRLLGVSNVRDVQPRMSRDFLVEFDTTDAAAAAERVLTSYQAGDGGPMFAVDNRGTSLFCMLSYTREIGPGFVVRSPEKSIENFDQLVSHVAIENAVHRTSGYFVDTGSVRTGTRDAIPLAQVFERTLEICELIAQ